MMVGGTPTSERLASDLDMCAMTGAAICFSKSSFSM